MSFKVYLQNGNNWSSYTNNDLPLFLNEELFILTIQSSKKEFNKNVGIVCQKTKENLYYVHGVICRLGFGEFHIGKLPMYELNDYKEFSLYEVIFFEELKTKIKTIVKKGMELIKKENEDLNFATLSKKIKEKNQNKNNEILNLLNEFLKEIGSD